MGAFGVTTSRLSRLRPLPWRWRLPAAALGLLAGEVVAARGGTWPWRILFAGTVLAPVLARRHRACALAGVLFALGVASGVTLGWRSVPPPRFAHRAGAQRVVLTLVDALPLAGFGGRDAISLVGEVEAVLEGNGEMRPGDRVRLRAWQVTRAWSPGDRVFVRIEPRRARGTCNGGRDEVAAAAARDGVGWSADLGDDRSIESIGHSRGLEVGIASVRRRIARVIDASVDVDAAPIVRSIVIGDPRGLSPELREAYARTGTTHVLSVSGLHVAIVAGAALAMLRVLLSCSARVTARVTPARLAGGLAIVPTVAYVALAGAEIPAVRSLVAGLALLGGLLLRRRSDPVAGLAAGALWIGASDPAACLEASFQLSFGAVIAIGAGLRAVERGRLQTWVTAPRGAHPARRLVAALGSATAVSLCAAVGTAPITAAHFGTVSAAGVLANLLVVPLVGSVALVSGLAGVVLLPVLPGPASAPFGFAGVVVSIANAIVIRMAKIPGASFEVTRPSSLEACAWLLLVAGPAIPTRSHRSGCVALGLALLVAFRFAPPPAAGIDSIRVTFIDVGQGDATLVEAGGTAWLVDGGGRPTESRPDSGPVLASLRRREVRVLDSVAVTHPQLDHEGGVAAVLRTGMVRSVWGNGADVETACHVEAKSEAAVQGIPWIEVGRGSSTRLDGPRVLGPVTHGRPRGGNDDSLVLRWSRGASSILLPGDIEAAGERRLLDAGLPGTLIVRAPHHGSRTSSGEPFVEALYPALVVAGTGDRNRFGLPAPGVRSRWREHGALWLDTAVDGEVVVRGDGQLLEVETCRVGEAPGT